MINDLLNYLFSSEVDKELDAIKNEEGIIYAEAVPKFEHWNSRIKQFSCSLNEKIGLYQPIFEKLKLSESEYQIILSRFRTKMEISKLATDYIMKIGHYSRQIYKAKSLEEKRECLSFLRQYAQDETIKIDSLIKNEEEVVKDIIENWQWSQIIKII